VLIVLAIVVLGSSVCCGGGAYWFFYRVKATAEQIKRGEKVSIAGMEINAALPKEIPAYPGATQTFSMGAHAGKEGSVSYVFTTTDAPSNVRDFYHDRLTADGWRPTATTAAPEGAVATYAKGNQVLQIMASGSGGHTTVTLTHITSNKPIETPTTEAAPPTEPAPAPQ
jgi:hypothetical protein